ncbi:unnamed protein product [Adineta steineri]|uniref:Uncharacterized protein n=1 Tax=Adineta steineri TaxID=433720 RepID=A0A814TLB0_9BILA|nr:unnamed protein product [Adineta steineri]
MILCLLWIIIKLIESSHILNPSDLSCKRRVYRLLIFCSNSCILGNYRLITDQSNYIVTLSNPLITIHASIGLDNKHISSLLTELWHQQINQQPLILQSGSHIFKTNEESNKNHNISWNLNLSLINNKLDSSFNSKSLLNIQSTLYNQQINLFIREKQDNHCSYPNSSKDFALCCNLCTTVTICPEIKILSPHSRYDIIVTNYGLLVSQSWKIFDGNFICLLFPSNRTNRFWSTITHAMNINQIPDINDIMIIQHPYGIQQNIFYYSLYPFHQWKKYIIDFHFIDVLFIPYKQLAIFELNLCDEILCKLVLRIYEYKLNKTVELHNQLYCPDVIIEKNVSSLIYFQLYFNILSNVLYLIGKQNIYASNDYGAKLIRIWTNDLSFTDLIILNPIVFSDTGHIAFIYELKNHPSYYYYFAVFSKAGLFYGWRTRLFRSSVQMDEPFFFDYSGSLYFNASPPLLIIQATEQSLVATSYLLMNNIPGPFFVRETDMDRIFVFCSLSSWDNRFELIGSTLQFDKLGLFFVINKDISSTEFAFCLQTSRLNSSPLETSRQCQLKFHSLQNSKKIHLQLSKCTFTNEDQNSTIITSKYPNIFIDSIINNTFASGRIFQDVLFNNKYVDQWNIIHIQVEQVLDKCLLQNLGQNHHLALIYIPPSTTYPISNGDNLDTLIQPEFEINSDLSKLIPIEPPINFQLNRYQAGFNSVIVYNLDYEKYSICDGFKNCTCISTLISYRSIIHCAQRFYIINSTVNNRVYMKLWIEKDRLYIPNDKSIFLIEEVSKRNDYELIDNSWTNEMKENIVELFLKNLIHLTDNEIHVFRLLNSSLSYGNFLFLGPNLKIKFMDEGLYHFRITYLWGDQFCLTSIDLLILMISNTPTLTSYTFNYFFNCILILILMFILWINYVIFHEKIYRKIFVQLKKETFFVHRPINDHINFEMLVKIREQSQKLLPYRYLLIKDENI